jgi:hypothetical protein
VSVGHPRGTEKVSRQEAERIFAEPRVRTRLAQKPKIDRSYDLPYLGGYSRDGRTVYIDRHFPASVKIGGKDVNAVPFIVLHEHGEKTLLDVLGLSYQRAHVTVTAGLEHPAVEAAGYKPEQYEAALKPFIKADAKEKLTRLPPDLDMKPYIESRDTTILNHFKATMNRAQWRRAVAQSTRKAV